MTQVKQTVRSLITNYGAQGKELFDKIETELRETADECAEVDYLGPNSDKFKQDCVSFAEEFAEECTRLMTRMTDAINANASFIAQNLGGARIELEPPSTEIVAPPYEKYDRVERINGEIIRGMRDSVSGRLDTIIGFFNDNEANFKALGSEGWIGVEYDEARDALMRITGDVIKVCTSTQKALVNRVDDQLRALNLPV